MPSKKDNLPVSVDVDLDNGGTIKYANEVIAIIAGVAASEVEGIAGMCTSGGISDIIGRNRNITRGVKVEIGSEEASVDLYIIVEYGSPIQKVAAEVQENVRKAIETMTGLRVVGVDVHVQGVSFEKEKKDAQNVLESAHLNTETTRLEQPKAAPVVEEAPAKEEIPAQEEAPAEAESAVEAAMEAVEEAVEIPAEETVEEPVAEAAEEAAEEPAENNDAE